MTFDQALFEESVRNKDAARSATAGADVTRSAAAANLANAQAQQQGALTGAALLHAQGAFAAGAGAGKLATVQAGLAPAEAASHAGYLASMAALNARTNPLLTPEQAEFGRQLRLTSVGNPLGVNPPVAAPAPAPTWDAGTGDQTDYPASYSKGTAKVPGKGSGQVDTVPAMLAPGEAVLNHHAAELIGRDKIAAANAMGNHVAKGMVAKGKPAAAAKAPGPQKLADGTHMVGHGKSAKTPAKIDPGTAMAMLQMLKGGGGGMPPAPGGMPA